MSEVTTWKLTDINDDHVVIVTSDSERFGDVLNGLIDDNQDHPSGGVHALNGRYRIDVMTTVDGDDVSSWVWSFIR